MCTFEKWSNPFPLHPVIFGQDNTAAEQTGQLYPFVSLGPLNES